MRGLPLPKHRLELPPKAEPARDFIEALVARYELQIEELKQRVQSLSKQLQSLTELHQKPNTRNSSVPPSSEHPHGKPPRKPHPPSSLGDTPHPTDRDRVPATTRSPRMLWYYDLGRATMRSAPRAMRTEIGRLHRTVKIQNLVSDALSEPYCQLQTELANQSQLYVDESPTKQHKAKAWLWVAIAPMFAVLGIFANRSRESLVALIGDYSNTGNDTNAQRSIGKNSGD